MFTVKGVPVIASPHITETQEIARTWRERLFSLPWRPLRKTKTVVVPRKDLFWVNGAFYGHPATIEALRERLKDATRPPSV